MSKKQPVIGSDILIKREYTFDQIASILFYIYNNGMYVHEIYDRMYDEYTLYLSKRRKTFDDITTSYTKTIIKGNYQIRFGYDKDTKYENYLRVPYKETFKLKFVLPSNIFTFNYILNYNTNCELFDVYSDKLLKNYAPTDLEDFKSYQLRFVKQLKFFIENHETILNKLEINYYSAGLTSIDGIRPKFHFIQRFKKYEDILTEEPSDKDLVVIDKLCNCIDNMMVSYKKYKNKILSYEKKGDGYCEISIVNKRYTFNTYDVKNCINNPEKRIPNVLYFISKLIRETGGIKELESIILLNRIVEE